MRILAVTAEMFPFVKTGGLADAAGALPEALARQGRMFVHCCLCTAGSRHLSAERSHV